MLSATTEEMLAQPALLPAGHQTNGGDGVVVGIIDYGCDFAHKNFRNKDGSTRLLAIWDQNGNVTAASPFGYGKEHSRDEINLALQHANPYTALDYAPEPNSPSSTGTHGTHVMDIAAGNGNGTGTPGVAPKADLIFVDVSHADLAFQGPGMVDSTFGDSVRLLEALKYIFDNAGNRPCVINISLGTNGGPHDGTTLVEQGIDSLLRARPNRAVTIAASNAFDDGIHAAGVVQEGQTKDLLWELLTVPRSDLELEVWYKSEDRFTVELSAPDGSVLATVAPGASPVTLEVGGQVAVLVTNRLQDPNNSDNNISVFLSAGMPAGTYTVRLKGDKVTGGSFHAWIERDNLSQSQFARPHDNSHTIGSISCGHLPIVVGSYDAHKPTLPLSYFSSAGPTRDGRSKPEVSAPGHGVLAAKSRTQTGVVRKSGTSMAAPAVAGVVALVFAEAQARSQNLTIEQTRALVIDSTRRTPPPGNGWHPQYGEGRVSAKGAVEAVAALVPPVPVVDTTTAG
jgi:subtilisin family serine protease